MKISARNQFKGRVASLRTGAVNSEISVEIAGGNTITAIITNASAQSLGLAVGKEVIAVVKASSVLLMSEGAGLRLSARNCLAGQVKALTQGAVNSEVALALPGGLAVYAVITNDAVKELNLTVGSPATAVIKASSVILGVLA